MGIPVIPIEDLLAETADAAIIDGAASSGFLTISGADAKLGLGDARRHLLSFFDAGPEAKQRTLRHKYDPSRPNLYRGYFPAEPEKNAMIEGFDIGADVADPTIAGDGSDPLTEPTPHPGLDGWDDAAKLYTRSMHQIAGALTRSLLCSLNADDALEGQMFGRSISTLRLLRYPAHSGESFGPDQRLETPEGIRFVMTPAHTDSGFVTLLWQDGTGGLQAETPDGWIDVPPVDDGIIVNFGQMLSDWSGGRIRATRHRVLGGTAQRVSVPFFFEPGVNSIIEPIFGHGEPFVYGDFLWDRMRDYPMMKGVHREPTGL